ncbi:SMK killer toxin resistance protein [Geranomyces variabilis]|nr:SMK killer toxin resistance protein [Geranomyces variabilis]
MSATIQHLPRIDSKNPVTDGDNIMDTAEVSSNAALLAPATAPTKPPPSSDSDSIVLLDRSSSSSSNSMRFSASDSEHDDAATGNADAHLPALVAQADEEDEKLLDIVVAYINNEAKLGDAVAAELVRRGVLDEVEGQELGTGGAVAAEPAEPESARQSTDAESVSTEPQHAKPEIISAGEIDLRTTESIFEPAARDASSVIPTARVDSLLHPELPPKPVAELDVQHASAIETDLLIERGTPIAENILSLDATTAAELLEEPTVPSLVADDLTSTTPPPAPSQPAEPTSILQEIWASIFTPGVNPRVQSAMNLSFAGLFVSLAMLAVVTRGNIHVFGLMGVAVCLFASVQWFVGELAKMPPPPATYEEAVEGNSRLDAAVAAAVHEKNE